MQICKPYDTPHPQSVDIRQGILHSIFCCSPFCVNLVHCIEVECGIFLTLPPRQEDNPRHGCRHSALQGTYCQHGCIIWPVLLRTHTCIPASGHANSVFCLWVLSDSTVKMLVMPIRCCSTSTPSHIEAKCGPVASHQTR